MEQTSSASTSSLAQPLQTKDINVPTYSCLMCKEKFQEEEMDQDMNCCLDELCLKAKKRVIGKKCYRCGVGYPQVSVTSCAQFDCGKHVCKKHKYKDDNGDWCCSKKHGVNGTGPITMKLVESIMKNDKSKQNSSY